MKILILDPHGDDWLWCAGEIKRCIDSGDEVYYIRFGMTQNSIKKVLNEIKSSLKRIGIKNYDSYNFPIRKYNSHRQEILEILVSYRNKLIPDIVYTPSTHDIHQDHKII